MYLISLICYVISLDLLTSSFYAFEVILRFDYCRVPEKEFLKAYKAYPRLKTKVNNFQRQMSSMTNSEDEYVAIRPEWTTVDRLLARRCF